VKGDFDLVALHPYAPKAGSVLKRICGARRAMKRAHDARTNWFDWRDPQKAQSGCSWCFSAGLLGAGGKPKPSFKAFKRVS
jgi:hypothetical protein